jgi:YesN/AraC family two-component response regulator
LREYDVVITDLNMPRLGGLDFIKAVKDRYQGRIIVMTAYGSAETYCQTLDLGAHEYINKPIEYADLRRLLREILEPENLEPPPGGAP